MGVSCAGWGHTETVNGCGSAVDGGMHVGRTLWGGLRARRVACSNEAELKKQSLGGKTQSIYLREDWRRKPLKLKLCYCMLTRL